MAVLFPIIFTQLLLLAQSQIKPVWEGLPAGYALEVRGPKDFDPASKLSTGQTYGFRLRANPTKRMSAGHAGVKKDGPRVPLKTEQEQRDWLARKSVMHGFTLLRAEISQKDDLHGRKDGYAMRWKSICFTGVLQVTDPAALALATNATALTSNAQAEAKAARDTAEKAKGNVLSLDAGQSFKCSLEFGALNQKDASEMKQMIK